MKIPESSRLEFLEKISANDFHLSDAEDNTSSPLNSRFSFVENTIGNLPKVQRPKFLGSDGLLCFISICKFGSFKKSFAAITSLSDFTLDSKGLFCWYKQIAQAAENHGEE